jgi:hypothetical protein
MLRQTENGSFEQVREEVVWAFTKEELEAKIAQKQKELNELNAMLLEINTASWVG